MSDGPNDYYLSEFEYVGGWYGISGLKTFLSPEGERRWHVWEDDLLQIEGPSNVIPVPPRVFALRALGKLLSTSPPAVSPFIEDDPKLSEWITQHESELRKLEPTGQGVDFSSQTCPNDPKSVRQYFLSQRIQKGDEFAMLDAGRTGDSYFLPFLQSQQTTEHAWIATLALTKLEMSSKLAKKCVQLCVVPV